MNISLVTLTTTAPLAGSHTRSRKPSQQWAYRMAYRVKERQRERKHGPFKSRGRLVLLDHIAVRSQAEVAAILGVSREAVRQVENRALSKLRAALLGLYGELTH